MGASWFCRFFCLTGSKNIVRVSFLCFRCFLVWKKVWIRNRGKGEKYHYFRSFRRKLLSHSANNFRGETFQVFRKVRVPKNFCIRRRSHFLVLKLFSISQCRNKSGGNHSRLQNTSGIGGCYASEKGHHSSPLKQFCLTGAKNSVSGPFCFRKFLVRKKL